MRTRSEGIKGGDLAHISRGNVDGDRAQRCTHTVVGDRTHKSREHDCTHSENCIIFNAAQVGCK